MFATYRYFLIFPLLSAACSSYPAPTQRMADAMATSRGAREVGAESTPQAKLHLRLAEEQIQRAKKLIDDGDNKRADFVLVRARADADLALAEARESAAEAAAQAAIAKVEAMRAEASQPTGTAPISASPTPLKSTTGDTK